MNSMHWKPIFHSWEISRYGSVRNRKTGYLLKNRFRKDGYLDVNLSHRRYLVHRLVAIAFIPNPNNFAQVNHLDGNRANPNADNLEWTDQFGNMKHAVITGLFPNRKGDKNGRAKLTEQDIPTILSLLERTTCTEIAKIYNVGVSTISNIKIGKTWSHICQKLEIE